MHILIARVLVFHLIYYSIRLNKGLLRKTIVLRGGKNPKKQFYVCVYE